jgi:hypothetical protein
MTVVINEMEMVPAEPPAEPKSADAGERPSDRKTIRLAEQALRVRQARYERLRAY